MRKKEKLTLREWLKENYKDFRPSESEMARIEIMETGMAQKVKEGGIEAIMTRLSNITTYSRKELERLCLSFAEDVNNPKKERKKLIGYLYNT